MQSITSKNFHLYVVSTPIGNLQEINFRALELFKSKAYFLCEDTRNTMHLFDLLKIPTANKNFIAYHKYNEKTKLQQIKELLNVTDLVLVSDAGYPGFSDPGHVIIQYCIEENIFVEVIDGANAFINAFIVSGFSNLPVTFYGFLDWDKHKDKTVFPKTVLCFYESVHRINKTINAMYKLFGNTKACIVRELTKLNETHYYGELGDLIIPTSELKGEFVILIDNSLEINDYSVQDISKKFIQFNKDYERSNTKNKIRLFLQTSKIENIKANSIYQELIEGEKND